MAYTLLQLPGGGLDLSTPFFEYLDLNPPQFKWERMKNPSQVVYYLKGNSFCSTNIIARTYKLKTQYSEELANDIRNGASQMSMDTFLDIVFGIASKELEDMAVSYHTKKLYIHSILVTSIIFDPTTFCPRRGLMVRFAIEPPEAAQNPIVQAVPKDVVIPQVKDFSEQMEDIRKRYKELQRAEEWDGSGGL